MMYQPHVETVLHELVESLPTSASTAAPASSGCRRTPRGSQSRDGPRRCRPTRSWPVPRRLRRRERLRPRGAGVGLDDYGFFENWLVCDFHLRREVPGLPTFRQVCNPAEPIAIVNIGPRYHRFSFRLEAQTSREGATQAERVWERVRVPPPRGRRSRPHRQLHLPLGDRRAVVRASGLLAGDAAARCRRSWPKAWCRPSATPGTWPGSWAWCWPAAGRVTRPLPGGAGATRPVHHREGDRAGSRADDA